MATQKEPEAEGIETVKVESTHITTLLEEHTSLILQNVNIPSIKPYLIERHCVGLLEEERLTKGNRRDNNLELMKIICMRGVEAFEGFLAALDHSVENDPGEKGHEELSKTLRMAYGRLQRRLSRSMSKALSSVSCSLPSSLQMSSINSHTNLEGIRVSVPEEDPISERDGVQQLLQTTNGPQDLPECSTPTVSEFPLIPEETEETPLQATSHYTLVLWVLGSIGILFTSLLLFTWGITLLVFSGEEFAGKINCTGIGDKHTLSTFNFFFGLLCLSVPGLLIMFMLYFHFENAEEECKQKIKRILLGLTIIFFLICFILTIGELLYSLLYIVQEVYAHYPEWRNNRTLCDGEIYISSFFNIILSYSVLFLVLVGLGIYSAVRYFLWITDPDNPGALRKLLSFEYITTRHNRER